jgi:quercetin dioxygenase-like cupin family protein
VRNWATTRFGERARLTVVEGTARNEAGGDVVDAETGTLLTLEPGERHSVASDGVLVSS